MDEVAALRALAGLDPSAFFPPDALSRHQDHKAHLSRLIRSHDPLVSHAATSILLRALRNAKPGPRQFLCEVLSPVPFTSGTATLERRRLTNALEACRRVVEEVCCQDIDPELRQEGGGENHFHHVNARATRTYVRRVAAQALPAWQTAALHSYVASASAVGADAEEAEDVELPLLWVIRLGLVLKRSYNDEESSSSSEEELKKKGKQEEEEGEGGEEEERALAKTLLFLCQACWNTIDRLGVGVESRRQVLDLALVLLREVEGGQDDADDEQRQESEKKVVEVLVGLCCDSGWQNSYARQRGGVADSGEGDGEKPPAVASGCSLVRPLRARDLFASHMALWAKITRWVVQRRSATKDSSSSSLAAGWEMTLLRLLQSPMCQAQFGEKRGDPGQGRRLLFERLAEDDHKLMDVLHDMLLVHWGLRLLPPMSDEGQRLLGPFLTGSDPAVLLSTFLDTLPNGSAEQLFLEFLLSNETCVLMYLVRLTKFVSWQQQQQQQQQRLASRVIVRAFLQRLSERLESLATKNLLPFDPSALLLRLRQLQQQAPLEDALCKSPEILEK